MLSNGSASTLKDFDTVGKLGQGSFGIVYKVKRKVDNNIYVMKQINISKMNTRMKQDAINEVHILSKLNNPYVVKYYDSFIDKNLLCIVMEYCDGGDLSSYLKGQMGRPLQEARIWKFFILSCMGLDYIHRKKILHRDIKTMNIFLTKDDGLRIGDLGVAKVLSDQGNFAHTMVGTPFYLSPEMCEEKPYNEKSDVWSLGCVLYELCTYRHPFEANNQGALVLRIIRGKYNPIPTTFSKDLVSIVDMCLSRDYKKRPNAREILSTSIVQAKAGQLSIELDYSKTRNKDVAYQPAKKEETKPEAPPTPSVKKEIIDIQRERNNAVLNAPAAKIISKSPAALDAQAKKQQSEQNNKLQALVDQKMNQQIQANMQKEEKKYKEKIQEMLKKDEVKMNEANQFRQLQNEQEERLKQQQQMFKKQKEREERIKKEEEKRQIERRQKEEEVKKKEELKKKQVIENERIKIEKELKDKELKDKELREKELREKEQKENDLKEKAARDFKIKQSGFDNKNQKKQLFGNQMPESNIAGLPKQQAPPPRASSGQLQYGYPKVAKKEASAPDTPSNKDQERQNPSRVRKGAPPSIVKNPFIHPFSNVKGQKDSQVSESKSTCFDEEDRAQVLNLPDKVEPKKAGVKVTVNDLRNVVQKGFEEDKSNRQNLSSNLPVQQAGYAQQKLSRPEQGKLPSVESFDSSFEDEPGVVQQKVRSANLEQEEDEQEGSYEDIPAKERPETERKKERLHYGKPFIDKSVQEKYEEEVLRESEKNQKKEAITRQQIVNDSFIDKEFGTSDDEEEEKKEMENTKFEFISAPKAKELAPWKPGKIGEKQEILDLSSDKLQNGDNDGDEDNNDDEDDKLGSKYMQSQAIDRKILDIENEAQSQSEDLNPDEDQSGEEVNEDDEENQYYEDTDHDDENDGEVEDQEEYDEDIEPIEDKEWMDDKEEQGSESQSEGDMKEDNIDVSTSGQIDLSTRGESVQSNLSAKKKETERKMAMQMKRQNELNTLLSIKVQECHQALGKERFEFILKFFKEKLNSEQELTDQDQEDIDDMIQQNMRNISNPQVINNFYKILHIEVELDKCKTNIKNLEASQGD